MTLFAALNYLQGKLITTVAEQHRHQEWLAFLKKIERETPKDLDIHPIVDNYATHKHPEVKAWLARHPKFHMHFTPTSSSWLNLVERFFRDLTEQIVSGSFASVKELADKIFTYLADRNQIQNAMSGMPRVEKFCGKFSVLVTLRCSHKPQSKRICI